MKKYVFKPYSARFPTLFLAEKARISERISECIDIQHVGSTAVPGLGGKGIIDIAIAIDPSDTHKVSAKLQELGYEFRKNGSTEERLFFRADLPDEEESKRRYHVHLTFPDSKECKNLLLFRDYLRAHPNVAKEYAKLKKEAAELANENGPEYRRLKAHIFKQILE
jgi:GrpB-like predicted nucleotidyltransferase (UPF0157 family)